MANVFNIAKPTNGVQQGATLTSDLVSSSYVLSYTCSNIGSNAFIMIYGINTANEYTSYFLPVQFAGEVSIPLTISTDTSVLELIIKLGGAEITNFKLSTVDNPTIEYVKQQSSFWDRIKEVTNSAGKLRADALEGLINTTVNAFANTSGTITTIDGVTTYLNGATIASSTAAMQLTGGAIRIADKKDASGNWVWDTAMTGAGINASAIVVGVLNAIDIIGSKITGGSIIGGSVTGVTVEGSTIYAGNREGGTYTKINSNGDLIRYVGNREVLKVSGSGNDSGGLITIGAYDGSGTIILDTNILNSGNQRMARFEFQGFPGGMSWRDGNTGTAINMLKSGTIQLLPRSGGRVYVEGDMQCSGRISAGGYD